MLWRARWEASLVPNGKGTVKTPPSPTPEGLSHMQRPKQTERAVDPNIAQWLVQSITRLAATYGIGVGTTILIGGSSRFAGLSYEVARAVPGAPATWGAAVLFAGLVMWSGTILAQPRVTAIGAWIGGVWALLFASAFFLSAVRHDEANTTATWTYLFLASGFFLLSGAHYAAQPIRKEKK